MGDSMKIGKKIRLLRQHKSLKIKELAELSGVSQSTISDIERDYRSPQVDTLGKICDALGVPIMAVLPIEHHLKDENAGPSLTKDELDLIKLLQLMSDNERVQLLDLLRSFLRDRKE